MLSVVWAVTSSLGLCCVRWSSMCAAAEREFPHCSSCSRQKRSRSSAFSAVASLASGANSDLSFLSFLLQRMWSMGRTTRWWCRLIAKWWTPGSSTSKVPQSLRTSESSAETTPTPSTARPPPSQRRPMPSGPLSSPCSSPCDGSQGSSWHAAGPATSPSPFPGGSWGSWHVGTAGTVPLSPFPVPDPAQWPHPARGLGSSARGGPGGPCSTGDTGHPCYLCTVQNCGLFLMFVPVGLLEVGWGARAVAGDTPCARAAGGSSAQLSAAGAGPDQTSPVPINPCPDPCLCSPSAGAAVCWGSPVQPPRRLLEPRTDH